MGARHAATLSTCVPGVRVAGVMDLDRSRAERLSAGCGAGVMVFEDGRELIRHGGIDAVVITTPDETHAGLVIECLEAGKPVFCEKPLATTVEEARRILDAEAALGRRMVVVGFMRRYDPSHREVREAIDSGAIGRPVLFRGIHRNAAALPGTTSESVLVNSAVHDLDTARWLLGQEIEEAYVSGVSTGARSDDGVLDLQMIQLRLGGGCLADIEVYVNAGYGYEVGLEVVGDSGTVSIAPSGSSMLRRQRCVGRRIEGDWLERFDAAYVLEMQRWIGDLHEGNFTGPDAWDGYVSLAAVECCISSLNSGSPQSLTIPDRPALYEGIAEVNR
ncbi:inositol 2-dehydrogenase [Rubrobacter taiwanensis]|jgi:myo-inositol 2-dehydrogenase/D-chiro-inositol 1-dehydrogenase|uniref:Inositol 2-dehydrogenase n=2 Tax=Rubrobacter taiwanensis TaxID=185139 RepID=A0A4R1BPZ1_9ACTN|nr:inositol 2-dehydrogenase [Rubrobacter taiwanensis]